MRPLTENDCYTLDFRINLKDMLDANGIQKVAVYGAGKNGCHVVDNLLQNGGSVQYVIDKNPDIRFLYPIPVVSPLEIYEQPGVDAIIISPNALQTESFKRDMQKIFSCKIICLSEMVAGMDFYDVLMQAKRHVHSQGASLLLVNYDMTPIPRRECATSAEKLATACKMQLDEVTALLRNNPRLMDLFYGSFRVPDEERDELCHQLFNNSRRKVDALNKISLIDCRSKYFNIINGCRYTSFTPNDYDASVYIYGHCNAVGVAIPDDLTCASQLQNKLNMRPISKKTWCVKNKAAWIPIHDTVKQMRWDSYNAGDYVIILTHMHDAFNEFYAHMYNDILHRDIAEAIGKMEYATLDGYHLTPKGHGFVAEVFYELLREGELGTSSEGRIKKVESSDGMKCRVQDSLKSESRNLDRKTENDVAPKKLPSHIPDGMKQYLSALGIAPAAENEMMGAIVMNCNPFTKGHRYLIEQAAIQCDRLVVFVVEEDRSTFSFKMRFEMVRRGVADLDNVTVAPSGSFILSMETFPDYFSREGERGSAVDPTMDISLFAEGVCPFLNIRKRFLGEEPYCPVTRAYNEAIRNELPQHGIDVIIIPRMEHEGNAISASWVRNLMQNNEKETLRALVPDTTFQYLLECGIIRSTLKK